jgi:hypothetical protein
MSSVDGEQITSESDRSPVFGTLSSAEFLKKLAQQKLAV